MTNTRQTLRDDALGIWRAGVAAVDSARLLSENVHVDGDSLIIADEHLHLAAWRRIVVVGAGKAGAGMADGFEQAIGDRLLAVKEVRGWLNVPADCVRPLRRIHLCPARPPGINEPTAEGITGTEEILKLVSNMTAADLCICLLSGGASALLPAPIAGISLADKLAITRHLSSSGANIQELNCVRKQLSRIKGGGLARECRAGRLITLIISDVLGDPLDVIASGPTVPDTSSPLEALRVLEKFDAKAAGISPRVFEHLENAVRNALRGQAPTCSVTNTVIGNNAVAVDAAGIEAERRGYAHAMISANRPEGAAEFVGRHHADLAWRMRHEPGPNCLITGGEPTVQLVEASRRGKGGRNQQLVLAALEHLISLHNTAANDDRLTHPLDGIAILSGGTDGEDGPTDAAGAMIDAAVYQAMLKAGVSPSNALQRNDAYHFFEPLSGLIKTGPTHTNVCDLRVVLVKSAAGR